jgi:hypothetical protein
MPEDIITIEMSDEIITIDLGVFSRENAEVMLPVLKGLILNAESDEDHDAFYGFYEKLAALHNLPSFKSSLN